MQNALAATYGRTIVLAMAFMLLLAPIAARAQPVESLRVQGATLQYRTVGAGPPIVLVGGGAGIGSGYLWPVADELAASGFRCVLYDQRGRGGSTAEALDQAHIRRLDALGVEHAQSVANTFSSGRLVLVEGASHSVWWDRPDEFFAAIVGFMREK